MSKKIITISDDIELEIEGGNSLPSDYSALAVTSAVALEFVGKEPLYPTTYFGSLPVTIGTSIYRYYYQLRVNRVLDALTAYSEAKQYILTHLYLYDYRLAMVALQALDEAFQDYLK